MNYCQVSVDNEGHLLNLIRLIKNEVLSAGGDGDAIWYSRYYNIDDIYPLIERVNKEDKFPWEILKIEKTIHWGTEQEWAIITNDEEVYSGSPPWIQMKIRY